MALLVRGKNVMNRTGRKYPVLMYHGIIADNVDLLPAHQGKCDEYDVDFADFKEQMRWLAENFRECVITFDDGQANNFMNAFPVLKEFGLAAYFFIVPAYTGQAGVMDRNQIRKLADAGMMIGSHSFGHCDLTMLSDEQLRNELIQSKTTLEAMTGKEVFALSVPFGSYDKHVLNAALEAGYQEIFVSDILGYGNDCIPRIAVRRNWTMRHFQNAVRGRVFFSSRIKGFMKNAMPASAWKVVRYVKGLIR